jgi:hypothetical protein
MSAQDNGGPAFPDSVAVGPAGDLYGSTGMTLRDYFAAKAMQAMITKSSGQDSTGGKAGVPLIAGYAYEFADAMLAERAK